MAKISYIQYTDILEARRYDAEYFKPECLRVEQLLKKLNSLKFGDVLSKITGGATPLGAEYCNKGIPFLRVQNIMQNYFNDDLVYISEKQDEEIRRSRLKENDVLLTITGVSYGKSAVVEKRYDGANINQHSVLMRFKNKMLNPYFIATFLNCYYGKTQSDKNVVGLSRPALDYNRIKDFFLIPNFPQSFQLQIEQIVKSAHQKQSQSKQLYREAEELLLAELGLLNYQVKHTLWFSATKKEIEVAKRYDSEYFQPKYAEIIKKIEEYEGGWDLVKDAINFKDRNYTPKV
jgi:type I restriction enzyme, S subunit